MDRLLLVLLGLRHDLLRHRDDRDDRGDVPGWVLVVVMTAGLCAGLYGVARGQLNTMLTDALNQVR